MLFPLSSQGQIEVLFLLLRFKKTKKMKRDKLSRATLFRNKVSYGVKQEDNQ